MGMHKRIEIDGRPHWLFATGEVLPVVSGGDGDGKGGDGDKGGDGKSGGDGSQSHMEPEGGSGDGGDGKSGDGQGGDGKGGSGDGGQGGDAKDKPMTIADFERIQAEREKTLFDRLADSSGKQVKNALKDLKLGQPAGDGKGGDGDKGGQGKSEPTPEDRARAEADRKRLSRDSRSAFRDILADDVKFMGTFEREDAMIDGSAVIAQAIAEGEEDEEAIGRRAAKEVKARVEQRRKFYEERTIAGLKRKGLLVETPGQRPQGGSQPQMESAFAAGRDKAQQLYGKPQSSGDRK